MSVTLLRMGRYVRAHAHDLNNNYYVMHKGEVLGMSLRCVVAQYFISQKAVIHGGKTRQNPGRP